MAAFLGSMGTDWLLKRAFKFMLKRNLGCLLRNEVSDHSIRFNGWWWCPVYMPYWELFDTILLKPFYVFAGGPGHAECVLGHWHAGSPLCAAKHRLLGCPFGTAFCLLLCQLISLTLKRCSCTTCRCSQQFSALECAARTGRKVQSLAAAHCEW